MGRLKSRKSREADAQPIARSSYDRVWLGLDARNFGEPGEWAWSSPISVDFTRAILQARSQSQDS
jgi:hypothetical protein